jgi:hypothetical protein
MAEHDDTTYEAPAVEDLDVSEGPATVAAGASQQTPVS